MANPKQPISVELRSRTGTNFRRAGLLWTGEWTPLPDEFREPNTEELKAKAKQLRDDPNIEFRIDGKRIPRLVGDPGDPEQPKLASMEDLADLRRSYSELDRLHSTLTDHAEQERATRDAELTEMKATHADEVSKLKAEIDQLKAAAKSAPTTTQSEAKAPVEQPKDEKKSGGAKSDDKKPDGGK